MHSDLSKQIRDIPWDTLTVADARETYAALREGVAAGAAWFKQFAEAFGGISPATPAQTLQVPTSDSDAPLPEPVITKKRGRPRKDTPQDGRKKHPPIGLLNGLYVGERPDPARPAALPAGHPRAVASPGPLPTSVESGPGDPDFAIIERAANGGKVGDVFN